MSYSTFSSLTAHFYDYHLKDGGCRHGDTDPTGRPRGGAAVRLLVRLRARADAAYDTQYHHKLRGRLWRAIENTAFDSLHGQERPIGLTFSNPFPPGDMREGDERTLLIAATKRDLLAVIAEDLAADRELNIGEMPFRITDISTLTPDVGEPGTQGTLETGTGLLVRIPPWRADDYPNVETDGEHGTFWRPEHTVEPLHNQLEANLDQKHDLFCPDPPVRQGSRRGRT